jgi:uncharacterized protein YkwD
MNFIDLLLFALIGLSVLNGWHRGFVLGLLDLVRWTASLLAGLRFYQPVGRLIAPYLGSDAWAMPVAFLLTAGVTSLAIHIAGHALIRRLPKETHQTRLNRAFGTLPGAISGLIAAAIASAVLLALPLPGWARERVRESPTADALTVYTEQLESALTPIFDEAIAQTLNKLMVRPESGETVELGFTVADTRPRPEIEARMLELVNRERAAAGLQPLTHDPELVEVARRHSSDMFARGYFSHNTPDGLSPFDRIRASNVTFRTAGENLALAPTLNIAHTGLMNSPGHRANILRPEFGRVGIGIMDGGVRGLMVTQNFRD